MNREFSSSNISARSMFTCSDNAGFLTTPSRAPHHQRSRSYYSSSSGRSTVDLSSSLELREEDDAMVILSANGRAAVENARRGFNPVDWKERKEVQGVHVFERRPSIGCFETVATSTLPCSVKEILEVLSSRNSDDFNATMVALAGDAFSYAVTLREVPTVSVNTHLTIKRIKFSGSIPLVSSTKTVEILDYVDFDPVTRTAVRTFQKLSRDLAGRLVVGGNVLAGYVLREKSSLHQTSVFYFGTHSTSALEFKMCGIVKQKAKLKAATVREAATHTLLKLAKMTPKIGDIALRRRFGAEDTTDPAIEFSCGEHTDGRCSGCGKALKDSLLRKKYVCYLCSQQTCGSCSTAQDVEGLIGVIERLRICCGCTLTTRRRAFEKSEETGSFESFEKNPTLLIRQSTLDVLSATSTASSL